MMIRNGVVVMVIIAVVCVSSWGAAQDFRGNLDKGQAIYGRHCLQCHGKLGDENVSDAKDLIVQPKEFHAPKLRGGPTLSFSLPSPTAYCSARCTPGVVS